MSKKTYAAARALPLSLLLILLLALTACGPSEQGSSSANGAPSGTEANAEHHTVDIRFATRMEYLHQRTVELGDILAEKEAVSADVRALATKMRAVHEPEIAQLQGMLRAWGELPGGSTGGSTGSASPPEEQSPISAGSLAELRAAQGEAAGQLYLELMIAHHRASIALAEDQIAEGTNPEAIALAETISTTQQQEIERMQALQQ